MKLTACRQNGSIMLWVTVKELIFNGHGVGIYQIMKFLIYATVI